MPKASGEETLPLSNTRMSLSYEALKNPRLQTSREHIRNVSLGQLL